MADAKKCDRCGKFYIDTEKKFVIKTKTTKGIPSWIKVIDINDHLISHYELCEECMRDLYHWLCNEEVSEEEVE